MKRILMLNTLPLVNFEDDSEENKTAGNQTLYNTLKGYSEQGFHVTMLTFADIPKRSSPFPNIEIRRSRYFPLFNLLNRLKIVSDHEETGRIGSSFYARTWNLLAYREGLHLSKQLKPDLLYGYEIYSTRPAKRIADELKLPCATRFQGTELGLLLNDPEFEEANDYIEGTAVNADLIIMANDGTDGDQVLERLGMEPEKIRFWPNGLHDKEKYLDYEKDDRYREKMDLPEDALIICTANRFVDWKRLDRVIKMMKHLIDVKPRVHLIAIGDGPEKQRLTELIKSLNLENIQFPGVMEHEETIYHIANADLYITLNESGNLGNSILEALSLGTVVCTLKNDSVNKVLKDGFNAMLFKEMDEKMIADGLAELLGNKEQMKMLEENGRQYAKEKLRSWPERMNLEIEEIKKLL